MAGEYQEQWNSSWIDRDCNLVSQEIVEWRLEIAHLPQMKSRDKIHNDKAPGTDVGARSRQTNRQKDTCTYARPPNKLHFKMHSNRQNKKYDIKKYIYYRTVILYYILHNITYYMPLYILIEHLIYFKLINSLDKTSCHVFQHTPTKIHSKQFKRTAYITIIARCP